MGMLVVLFLIITNIHSDVEGPSSRGFSFVEVWYIGMFIPIIIAMVEYAAILAALKYKTDLQYDTESFGKIGMKRLIAHIDMAFLCISIVFMIVFVVYYYCTINFLLN